MGAYHTQTLPWNLPKESLFFHFTVSWRQVFILRLNWAVTCSWCNSELLFSLHSGSSATVMFKLYLITNIYSCTDKWCCYMCHILTINCQNKHIAILIKYFMYSAHGIDLRLYNPVIQPWLHKLLTFTCDNSILTLLFFLLLPDFTMTKAHPNIKSKELNVCPLCEAEKSYVKLSNVKRHIKDVHKSRTNLQKRMRSILTHFFYSKLNVQTWRGRMQQNQKTTG